MMNLFELLRPRKMLLLPDEASYLLVHENVAARTNIVEYFFSGNGDRNLMHCYQLSPALFAANYIIFASIEELLSTQYAENGWIFHLSVSVENAIKLIQQGCFHKCIIKATDFLDEYTHFNEETCF